jgi:hypothetical protein
MNSMVKVPHANRAQQWRLNTAVATVWAKLPLQPRRIENDR